MTSSTTGDRRWSTTRRSGMTILGKVAVPKPINLPSQRLENQGLDPNVEIVPKGTLSWGSKSSLNAWGTSSLSPRTESSAASPSHLSNRPSSGGSVTRPSTGGSVTRPSTAGSDKAHESSPVAWDSNSRPSSASGVFSSNQAPVALQRPHSADTRPGSSHLSRFAEAVSDTSAEKLGAAPTKNAGFSLTSGDFPSLGAERESSEKKIGPQDSGPHACPASSSGRSVDEQSVDRTEEANIRIIDANAWRRDQPYSEDEPRHCREEGQFESCGSQSYPNATFPHQFDALRGTPVNNHQGGVWYRGNHPYGVPMGPGGLHMEPFPFYPTQVPSVPGHGVGPRCNHTTNGNMFRPPMPDSYLHPRMQTRPGFYRGPVPYEGYYGSPMGYDNPNNRDIPFARRPAGPNAYNKHSCQSGYDSPGSSVEPSDSQETQRPYKVILKPQDLRFGKDEAKLEKCLANSLHNAEKVAQEKHTSKIDRRENINEITSEAQPIKARDTAPEDLSLIQKIEGLNAKSRTNDGWQNASSLLNRNEQDNKSRTVDSGNSDCKISARISQTGHPSDNKNPLHYNQGNPGLNKNAELAATGGTAIFRRRPTQETQGTADNQTKQRVNNEDNDGWGKSTVMSGSCRATLASNSESFANVNAGDSLDTCSTRKPGSSPQERFNGESGTFSDPNSNQRSAMRELARQRAQQRQKEEEERARDQRAKALVKLEELNRRSQVAEESGSVKNLEPASTASISDMPEDHGPLSPALMQANADDIHGHSSLGMKTTVAAVKFKEPTRELRKTSMQSGMTSTEYANNVSPTQQVNLQRDPDGDASKHKRFDYKQKQNFVSEKQMAENSFPVATTEVFNVVPRPEVVNEGILSHNSDMPKTSSVSTESTFTKRRNSRNGKKKNKVEETTTINAARVAFGKEPKLRDESIETGRARAAEMEVVSVSVPSLDVKVSSNSSEQTSSFANEQPQSRAKNNGKSQHLRKTQRNTVVNKPAEKFPGSNAVIWAPVQPQQKADISGGVGSQNNIHEFNTSLKNLHQGQGSFKSKRVELERYVAKPIVKKMTEQIVSKNLITAPEVTENALQKENCGGGQDAATFHPSGSVAGKSGSSSMSRHRNSRQGKYGREYGTWHQRGSAASTKALEDGQFVTSNQPILETVDHHSSNRTTQNDVSFAKDGWNDGWYMTPETHYSATEELEASAHQAVNVGKDQGMTIQGKQQASISNKDGGINYGDPKKANKRDSNRAHMQHSGDGFRQSDLPAASKESCGPRDNESDTDAAYNNSRTGKYGGHEHTRDKAYGSQKKDIVRYQHQESTTQVKMTTAHTPSKFQNRSTTKEVQVERNLNSTHQKNTGQSRGFGRGQESQGGWGLSVQENMHHHRQRPPSNRDRQKQNLHYEYKPVGSRTYDGEQNREQLKDSSQTEGPRYREKEQSHRKHGGQKLYQQQRGNVGRNTGHGLAGERN